MKVRKLLVTDIRCRSCSAGPGEWCAHIGLLQPYGPERLSGMPQLAHGERIAEHAELERAGWEWQEVDPTDRGARPRGGG